MGGCMFAGMIFRREPFFRGSDNYDQLVKIARVLGYEGLHAYLNKYQLELDQNFDELLERFPVKPWGKFVTPECQAVAHHDAIDLLDKMLVYDHSQRILPQETFSHPYFEPVLNDQGGPMEVKPQPRIWAVGAKPAETNRA